MIPIQLTIEGLYSYREKQTIDFGKLTSSSLFGIFGTVGSGKSSILEAITFALYGRTDRLNLSGDNRYYNMMNLRSDTLLIDFIFENGSDQCAYRATVKSKRNSKRFEDVKTPEHTAYKKIGGRWVPIGVNTLEEVIGLSYDNFKRTIIIPQGQFQEFLQLGNRDRTQMMKELFNLQKFEFYYQVVSLESKNNDRKKYVEGQLQQLEYASPEQAVKYKSELNDLSKAIEELDRKLGESIKKEESLRNLQELTQKKGEAEIEHKRLSDQGPLFVELEKRINSYEQCVVQFKYLLDSLRDYRKKKEDREKQINADTHKLSEITSGIELLEKQIGKLQPAYEKREQLKKKAEDLVRLLQMKELEKSVANEESRLEKGTNIFDKTTRNVENLRTEKQQLEVVIKEERNAIPDLALLSEIRAWYNEKNSLGKQLSVIDKEIEKYEEQENEIRESQTKLLADPLFELLPSDAGYAECSYLLKEATEKVKGKQYLLGEQESHLRVKEQLKSYAEALKEGSPCPVCGSLHHPGKYKSGDIDEQFKQITVKKQLLEQQLNRIASFGKQFDLLESRYNQSKREQEEWQGKREILQQTVTNHNRQFVWEKYKEEETLDTAFKRAKQLREELSKHEAALAEKRAQLEKEESNRDRFREELEKIRTSLTIHRTELTTIGQQLTLIRPGDWCESSSGSIEREKDELLKEYARIEKEYTGSSLLLQEQKQRKEALRGSMEINLKELAQEQSALTKLQHQLDEQLEKSTFGSLDEVVQILSEQIDTEAEKVRLSNFRDQLLRSNSALEQLLKDIGDREYNPDSHQALLAEIATQRNQIREKTQLKGETAQQLKKLLQDLESQVLLREELNKLEARAENVKTMKSLFKASGFVNYISSVYLQNLCNAANDRFFRLTRQRLSLEITPDNNFQVRDFMNGGKVRNVKTLSGGQTFQASLSLALALADNIQEITRSSQNFFFLDEGFGSLDKESLDIVFDTLKSLRNENRIVGVISHVEEMQQEIDVHLYIENHPDKGSIIHSSWNHA